MGAEQEAREGDERTWMEIHVDTVSALVAERDEALDLLEQIKREPDGRFIVQRALSNQEKP